MAEWPRLLRLSRAARARTAQLDGTTGPRIRTTRTPAIAARSVALAGRAELPDRPACCTVRGVTKRAALTPNMTQILVRGADRGFVGGLGCTHKALAALRERGLVDPRTTALTEEGKRVANELAS